MISKENGSRRKRAGRKKKEIRTVLGNPGKVKENKTLKETVAWFQTYLE
jgi:hypothetical protein